jgi:hypothetical protein
VVNDPSFSIAFKEWELCRLNIKLEIQNVSTTFCPPCGKHPVMGSSDGNMKLKRYKSAGAVRKSKNERERLLLYHDSKRLQFSFLFNTCFLSAFKKFHVSEI